MTAATARYRRLCAAPRVPGDRRRRDHDAFTRRVTGYAAQWPASARPVHDLTAAYSIVTAGATPARQHAASALARPVAVIARPAASSGAEDQDDETEDEEEDVCAEYVTIDDTWTRGGAS